MTKHRSLALVLVLLVSTMGVAIGPASGADGVVTISIDTSPDRPAPGENVTISTTISNPGSSNDPYSLRRVEVWEADDDSTVLNSSELDASVGVGESATRDLSVAVDESGDQTFVVNIELLSNGEIITLERTVTVTAGQADPALSLSARPVGPSGETSFDLSVSNARTGVIRGLTIDLDSSNVDFDEDRRIVSQLDSGAETTLSYPASDVSVGEKSVTATIEYTTSDGEYKSATQELSTTVDRVDNPGNVSLAAVDVRNVDGELRITGDASNVGQTDVSSVAIAVSGDDFGLGEAQSRSVVGTIGAGESGAFDLAAALPGESRAATIPLRVSYLVDGERVTRTVSVSYEPGSRGNVSLSGVDVASANGGLTITGQADNVGETNVSSVRIAVDDDSYSLGNAQSRAFVGGLAPSASGAFELQASLPDGSRSVTIPLEVQYRVDGERVTETLTVRHDPGSNGDVDLTGVRIEQEGSRLTVRGSTSNLGTTNASAVVVSVGEGDVVRPTESESSYFVGTVKQSDFKSFQIDARLTTQTNETITIPIEVSYRVDGQRVSETIDVSYTPATNTAPEQAQRSSSMPIALIGGVVVLVLVAGFAYRRYR